MDSWGWEPRSVVEAAPNYRQSADALNLRDPFDRDSWTDTFNSGRFASAFGNRRSYNVDTDGFGDRSGFRDLVSANDNPYVKSETFWSQSPFTGRGYRQSSLNPTAASGSGWSDWGYGLPGFNRREAGYTTRQIFANNTRDDKGNTVWDSWGNGTVAPGANTNSGTPSNTGGVWALLDSWNDKFMAASQKIAAETGIVVPVNLIKAKISREGSFGRDFGRTAFLRGERIHAFNGIFESVARSWGVDFERMLTDLDYAIYAGGLGLAKIAEYQFEGKTVLDGWGWEGVMATYFSGKPYQTGWVDELGNVTGGGGENDYVTGPNGVITRWRELDASTGVSAGGGRVGGAAMSAIWGNLAGIGAQSQGFGRTDFAAGGGAWMYDDIDPNYWGYEGGHNGLDFAMPPGTQLYSPVSGKIIQAGGSQYGYGPRGPGVAGEGELKIQMDDGSIVVLGHTSSISVRVGQMVTAGQPVATSGFMLGAAGDNGHLHLETYKYDPTFTGNSMNLRLVDPTAFFGGVATNGQSVQAVQALGGPRDFHSYVRMAMEGRLGGNFAAIPGMIQGFTNPNRNTLLYTSIRQAAGFPVQADTLGGNPFGNAGGVSVDPSTGRPVVDPNSAAGRFVDLADNYLSTPYVLGGLTPAAWDCSGFTYWLGQQVGVNIPQGSHEQFNAGVSVGQSELMPGDLVFFNTTGQIRSGNYASHVAVYLGDGLIVHAMNETDGTKISNFSAFQSQFIGARRYF